MFGVPKHRAQEMVINYLLQKTFINCYKPQFKTSQTENNILGSKNPYNDPLTLNYVLPSSFTTVSTRRTTKRG